ncbi:MAG: type II secretion system protein [Clostridia bacterium]|nr:type II secretion system protein [Clostridia bacterium]
MKNKKGISLIVLVITIIVMVVLASAVIVTLSNSGIIDRATDATETSDLKQVEQLANLAWSEAYLDKAKTDAEFEEMVLDSLDKNGVNTDDYIIEVDKNGVTINLRPQLNEYGFYYKQLYYSESDGMGLIFYPGGEISIAQLMIMDETYPLPSRLVVMPAILMGVPPVVTYSNKSISLDGAVTTVSEDGKTLIAPDGSEMVCNFEKVHYTYKNCNYVAEYQGTEVKVSIDGKGNAAIYIDGVENMAFANDSILDRNKYMGMLMGSTNGLFTSVDGNYMVLLMEADIIPCKRDTTKTNPSVSSEIYTGTWETKKEFSSGKMSKAVVTNGTKEIELGTLINYMPNGVGPTSYRGNWMLFGTDDQGRLLIASVGILEKLAVTGKNGYDTIVSTLEQKAKNYKDGTIGIAARSIKMQDLVDLLEFDPYKSSYYSPYYGDTATYSWSGTNGGVKLTYEKDGNTQTSNLNEKFVNGFTYRDETTNKWITVPFVEGNTNDIVTMTHTAASMDGSYIAVGVKLKSFLMYNGMMLDSSANQVSRLVADVFQNAYSWGPDYGVYGFTDGLDTLGLTLASGGGQEYTVYGTPCAIVTLSPNVKLKESSTVAGGYDVSL